MSFFRSFDWFTFIIYVVLVIGGIFTINAASYNWDDASIFDFARPSGKQIMWAALAIGLIITVLCVDVKTYMTYAPIIYIFMMVVLLVTIFVAGNINGSHSWIKVGSFFSIQPAEFGKFSTALMMAWLFNTYSFKFTKPANFIKAVMIVFIPVILIILQEETGSALVYLSLILLFYRQGMSGIVLWAAFCAVMIFVLGVKFSVDIETGESIHLGQNIVLAIIPYLTACMLVGYSKNLQAAGWVCLVATGLYLLTWLLKRYVPLPFELEFRWVGWLVCGASVLYGLWLWLLHKNFRYALVAGFSAIFTIFLYCVDYAFNSVLEKHQRSRIEVLLGMKEDLHGAGWNVNQAKIAIGSGRWFGKGYLEGTQTKLDYVPEQQTDFIFCTIGEEEGFVGCVALLLVYAVLILRIIYLAERQRTIFAQVYGYCVASIFAFHVMINVGMVIGLVPVIGIPLPFFSYGGSGLWSFTILLFILLKLDSARIVKYSV